MTTKLFDITTPAFGGTPVRTIDVDGTPWFAAVDVMKSLNVTGAANRTYLARQGVAVEEIRGDITTNCRNKGPGRPPLYISATAVRRIAQRSTKPAARAFQDFLNGTVAGAIEKDGAYVHPALGQQNPEIFKMLGEMKATLKAELQKEFGTTVKALTTSYETLIEKQKEQELTGTLDRMPLRNYCGNTGKHVHKNHIMSGSRMLKRAYVKRYGKDPDREITVREGRPQAYIFPVPLIREIFDPFYARIVERRPHQLAR
jgi:prophage antirepressor-like protein